MSIPLRPDCALTRLNEKTQLPWPDPDITDKPSMPALPLDPRHAPDRHDDISQRPLGQPRIPCRTGNSLNNGLSQKKKMPKVWRGKKAGGEYLDDRPIYEREWSIIITDQELAAILAETLGMKTPETAGLVTMQRKAIIKELRYLGVKKPYHDVSEVFQEAVLAMCQHAKDDDDPIQDLPAYLRAVSRNAAKSVVYRSRCVSEIRNKDGKRSYVSRLKEFTPEIMENLQDKRDENEELQQHEAIAEKVFEALPVRDRFLFLAYIQGKRCKKRETFLKDHKETLSSMGIDTNSKLGHWVRQIQKRLFLIREDIERRAKE